MTKAQFIDELMYRLEGMPREDAERIRDYCTELIDDRCEEGYTEEAAVEALGSLDDIIKEAREAVSPGTLSEKKPKRKMGKSMSPWVIILLIIGSPVWLSLFIVIFAVMISLYVTAWALTTPVYALCAGFGSGGITSLIAGFAALFTGHFYECFMMLGAAFLLLGLFGLMLLASIYTTKGMIGLTKWFFSCIKYIITGKGNKK